MDQQRTIRRQRRQPKPKCPDCVHAIFDETWGEYKCKERKVRIYDASKYASCKSFVKKEKKS